MVQCTSEEAYSHGAAIIVQYLEMIMKNMELFLRNATKISFSRKEALNQSTTTEFALLGFSDIQELKILHFVIFLSIYLATLIGNILLIITVIQDPCLHSPMYFFLVFLVITFAGAELFLLTVMSYDRKEALNQSTATEFVLLGFSDIRELQILHFVMFLSVYLATLIGNSLLMVIVIQDPHLHSPMYFFLANLSLSDIFFISTTVPKSMAISLTTNKLISFSGCFFQIFLTFTFAGVDLFLLTIMSYDRYVAICYPLQYSLIMNWDTCIRMAAASWIGSMIHAAMHTAFTFRLQFCKSNFINQFFCDIPPLLMISCTDTMTNQVALFVSFIIIGTPCFALILVSYRYIFSTVFKVRSVQARYKAFSTCIPHLVVFCLFLFTSGFAYLKLKSWSSPTIDLLAAVFYRVVPPLMNPFIYSLRNKDIHAAFLKMLKCFDITKLLKTEHKRQLTIPRPLQHD
ncbi:olfactory receptor 14A16-like [Hemicordylus capensis]|uniref:olfactory receptor 14A16-like n=1 Tax=Hemicordylus capensis TaxID=884348 RepID=UPI00230257F2|nr:olfactory receptor 14A16-like [Hemicordylus capensis]